MTREELKEHCKRMIQEFERVEKIMPVTPNAWKRYEEHKLILELLEQESVLDKIRDEIEAIIGEQNIEDYDFCNGLIVARNIIDKYRESEGEE